MYQFVVPPATPATSRTLVLEPLIGIDPEVTDETVQMNDTAVDRLKNHGYQVQKAADNEAKGNW